MGQFRGELGPLRELVAVPGDEPAARTVDDGQGPEAVML
jgi:hypothetical protein